MIGVLLVAALGAVAIGAALVLGRRTFEAGLWTQAAGAAGVGVAGFWALGVRRHTRCGVHELVRSALRRRRSERALPRHARLDRGSGARVLAPVSGADPTGARDRCAHRGVLPRARARRLRPRSADVPHGLGVDDAAVGHGDPRRAARRQAVAADGVQLPRRHPPRRRRHLDRNPAARARGRVRRTRLRSAPVRDCRSRSPLRLSWGWGRRQA